MAVIRRVHPRLSFPSYATLICTGGQSTVLLASSGGLHSATERGGISIHKRL